MKTSCVISPLQQALDSFKKALDRSKQAPHDLEVRDACIQRFEYTYTLCIKLIKRYLKQEVLLSDDVEQLNYRDLLRVACKIGLIQEVEAWFQYREARNETSHAYDQHKAQMVYAVLPYFEKAADFLVMQLQKRLEQ